MKKLLFFLVVTLILSLTACISNSTSSFDNTTVENKTQNTTSKDETTSSNQEEESYRIKTAPFIDDNYSYKSMTLTAGDTNIPLYNCMTNFAHSWNPDAPSRMDA